MRQYARKRESRPFDRIFPCMTSVSSCVSIPTREKRASVPGVSLFFRKILRLRCAPLRMTEGTNFPARQKKTGLSTGFLRPSKKSFGLF